MQENRKQREKRIKMLAVLFAIMAVIFSVSTYAWFIGTRTVHVSPFDVKIAAVDQLSLSLNGIDWSDTVAINETNFADPLGDSSYTTNTNWWSGDGLIPMSSIGEMDDTASRMVLFEKASLTATPGGYRLMASKIENSNPALPEKKGYIAFDLFVKNLSGSQYIENLDELDEEAIYLAVNSEAKVATSGVENTGIENSVRVAFAQIGRVEGTAGATEKAIIQGITCTDDTTDPDFPVTGICAEKPATIWEPNDRNHVGGAINWYNTSCQKRIASTITDPDSFDGSGTCGTLVDGLHYPTYAVNAPISSAAEVDVYDGGEYNSYTSSTLTSVGTFTDSDKLLRGMERPPLMTLAPNSITKVRVYIWIEGQDIDNYDFAAIGKMVTINFGFAKERFEEDDIDYPGPTTNQGEGPDSVNDLTPPVITLAGLQVVELTQGTAYVEATHGGITSVVDAKDGTIANSNVEITGTVNENVKGTYQIVYKVADAAGNVAVKTRSVIIN